MIIVFSARQLGTRLIAIERGTATPSCARHLPAAPESVSEADDQRAQSTNFS
jgi:hypothetical protein